MESLAASLKKSTEKLLRRLIGTWDFVIQVPPLPEPIVRHYVVRGVWETDRAALDQHPHFSLISLQPPPERNRLW